jgi:PadR family transcriptional regulator, regulatory protein AphA
LSLPHALLALLDAGPMTGYELAKQFDRSADHVWHATHPQIYTELRRLEGAGLVAARELPRGRGTRAVKREYHLTAAGRDALCRWVASVEPPHHVRDVAYLRATYLEYAPAEARRAQFEAHRAHFQDRIGRWQRHVEQLESHATDLLRRRLDAAADEDREAVVAFKVHAYRGLIDRARAEVAWAEEGIRLVARLEEARLAGSPASGGGGGEP